MLVSREAPRRETGFKCTDPYGMDKDGKCVNFCHGQGYPNGSCQGYTNHFMCECYVG